MDIHIFKKLHETVPSWLEYDGRNVRSILDRYTHRVEAQFELINQTKRHSWVVGAIVFVTGSILGLILGIPNIVPYWTILVFCSLVAGIVFRIAFQGDVINHLSEIIFERDDWNIISDVSLVAFYHSENIRLDWSQAPHQVSQQSLAYLKKSARGIQAAEASISEGLSVTISDDAVGCLTGLQFHNHYHILRKLGLVSVRKATLFQ